MLTLKRINTALSAEGIDAELLRCKDHFYLDGEAVVWAYSTTIAVYRLNHLTLQEWVNRAKEITLDSIKRNPT